MRRTSGTSSGTMLHPLHAILLAFPLALFSAALASDVAYLRTAELQWSNFSAWMITGAMVFGGAVLVWALVAVLAPRRTGRMRGGAYLAAVVIMLAAGLLNAFQHSRDGWSSVGATGLVLSILSTLAAVLAAWIGYSSQPTARRRA